MDRIAAFEAHSDYVRSIAVHPTQPFVLTSSDDMSIKLWNWEKNWANQQVFEGHTHYVMQIVINPKDNNTFASASLDRTVKVWQLGSNTPNFTLEGHEKGVNCVDYYHAGDKPYLISGADDRLVKIWDYQNKTCVQTLEGHAQNISSVAFHPELPILLTGSEDGTVKVWHSNTYRLETTLNYGLERVWTICCLPGSNNIALGYDEGSIMIKLGREEPAMSMDQSGKIIWAKHSEIQQANLKALPDYEIKDGERLPLAIKDMGACEIYPQTVSHNSTADLWSYVEMGNTLSTLQWHFVTRHLVPDWNLFGPSTLPSTPYEKMWHRSKSSRISKRRSSSNPKCRPKVSLAEQCWAFAPSIVWPFTTGTL